MRATQSRGRTGDPTDALRRWLEGHDGALEEWLEARPRDRPRAPAPTEWL